MSDEENNLETTVKEFAMRLHNKLHEQKTELDESMLNPQDFEKLAPNECFQYVSDWVKELIELKRNFTVFQTFKGLPRDKTYQKSLQKLEEVSRNHNKVQHQLRLYIDELQSDVEKSKNKAKNIEFEFYKTVEELEAEKKMLELELQRKDKKIHRLRMINPKKIELSEGERKSLSFDITGGTTSKMIEVDNKRMEEEIKEKEKECRELEYQYNLLKKRLYNDRNQRNFSISQQFRHKYEEKCQEVLSIQKNLENWQVRKRQSRSHSPFDQVYTEPSLRRNSKSPLVRPAWKSNSSKKIIRVQSLKRTISTLSKPHLLDR
ncbi:unnamed protein product [Blepharisma stoltei]|uniref:Uncharacterized protein n=1 Tax=Blepharisma stoltei TaxID=1481888 RepID=A0AAU9IZ02_9CILI|nr:unnamed protein product [Blepharisma stoltei]